MLRAVRLILPAFCLLALPVQAAVFTVTKTADTLDGACDRDCSLREAVSAANADEPGDEADVVVVPAGIYELDRLGAGEDANATGDLDLHDEIILVGAGAGSTILSGWGFDRVLDVRARTEIFGVTIRAGRVEGDGGGLLVRPGSHLDVVFLRRSVVSGNLAENSGIGGGTGGGIAVQGYLEVSESAILENHAEGEGGGISAGEDGFFSLTNATVAQNRAAGSGGGLAFSPGNAAISSSTIVFNEAQVSGGGIFARPAPLPGFNPGFLGSIVVNNSAPQSPDCKGASSSGYNVIGFQGDCNLEPTDATGLSEFPIPPPVVSGLPHPGLGPTPVYTLLERSVALDMVPAQFCEPADQTGQARTGPCDAGAWEQVGDPVCIPGGSGLCLQNGRFRVNAVWGLDDLFPREPAQAVPLTDDTGNYWFFHPQNLELMVKVLDGCAVNQRWWVFSSGLTDVAVALRVEDLETGRTWDTIHPKGSTYLPRLDTDAFPCALAARSTAEEAEPEDSPAVPALPAAVLRVTKTADTDDGSCDHDCSLREAVLRARQWGEGVIVLGPGVYTLGIPGGGEDEGHTGDLDPAGYLVILGAGADRTVIDGGGLDRVIDAQGILELHGVTVRGGWSRAEGGGIRSVSDLALVRSTVQSNRADHESGGIAAFGSLIARDSTISGNVAGTSGGGLSADLANLENVTLSGNQAGDKAGGAILEHTEILLRNVTITGNTARFGGGLVVETVCQILCVNVFEMQRTVIAGNTAAIENGSTADCLSLPGHLGAHNLFGIGTGCSPSPGDLSGTPAQPLDPRLTPLGNHGGPTFTHALLPDSPAIDLAPAASCPQADQRGRLRPADGDRNGSALCDAGAVERLPACQPDEETLCLGAGDRFRVTARWTAQGTNGPGKAVPLAAFNGSFWFFDAANLEITVKVLDGCGVNDRFWVFLSGLTDVGVEVTVEDTATSNTWTHGHAAGTPLQPRLDTNALNCVHL
ncbi:MAG TPA: CSLREA domain-containing protein [Thermoanaerobaculia bacterium]|nr:CSLREA domain-containing protein [Thermoanaerobaculia bacterium]